MPLPDNNLRIRLIFVGDRQVSTEAPAQIDKPLSAEDIKIQFAVRIVIDRPESQVGIIVSYSYLHGQGTLFSASLTTKYEVLDLASYVKTTEGEDSFKLENDFLPMLVNIAFSTTRGYFVRELEGTVLEKYPFPIVSMDSIKKRTTYKLI